MVIAALAKMGGFGTLELITCGGAEPAERLCTRVSENGGVMRMEKRGAYHVGVGARHEVHTCGEYFTLKKLVSGYPGEEGVAAPYPLRKVYYNRYQRSGDNQQARKNRSKCIGADDCKSLLMYCSAIASASGTISTHSKARGNTKQLDDSSGKEHRA